MARVECSTQINEPRSLVTSWLSSLERALSRKTPLSALGHEYMGVLQKHLATGKKLFLAESDPALTHCVQLKQACSRKGVPAHDGIKVEPHFVRAQVTRPRRVRTTAGAIKRYQNVSRYYCGGTLANGKSRIPRKSLTDHLAKGV